MALTYNINRPAKRPAVKPAAFLPAWAKPEQPPEPTEEELLDKIRTVNAAMGGKVRRRAANG